MFRICSVIIILIETYFLTQNSLFLLKIYLFELETYFSYSKLAFHV